MIRAAKNGCDRNKHLFYYLTQMHGYSGVRPKELEYFNCI